MSCLQVAVRIERRIQCYEYDVRNNVSSDFVVINYKQCSETQETIQAQVNDEFLTVCSPEPPIVQPGQSGSIEVVQRGPCDQVTILEGLEYLDIDPESELRETKQPTLLVDNPEGSDDGEAKLQFSYSLGFDLPRTQKNIRILNGFINPNVISYKEIYLPVRIYIGHVVLSDNYITVEEFSNKFTASLVLGLDHWTVLGASMTLNQIELGSMLFNYEDIDLHNEANYPYDDTKAGFYFPIHDAGGIYRDGDAYKIPLAYLKPYVYLYAILKQGFCQMDYSFQADFFETDYGSKIAMYLISKTLGRGVEATKLSCRAEIPSTYTISDYPLGDSWGFALIRFDDLVYDKDNNFDLQNSIFTGNGSVNVKAQVKGRLVEKGYYPIVFLAKIDRTKSTREQILVHSYQSFEIGDGTDNSEFELEFEVENISAVDLYDIALVIGNYSPLDGRPSRAVRIDSGYIEYVGVEKYVEEGETKAIADFLSSEVSFLDLIKGISHVFNLRWQTNPGERKITCYPAYNTEINDEAIEGYYNDTLFENISTLIDDTTYKVKNKEITQSRFVTLAFKDSTDGSQDINRTERLWSRTVDLGSRFLNGSTEERINPFIEPTLNLLPGELLQDRPYIPTSRREDVEHTLDLEPRIVLIHGKVVQVIRPDDVTSSIRPSIKLGNDLPATNLIPTAAQLIVDKVKIGQTHNDINSGVYTPKENIVFGVSDYVSKEQIETLYDWFYRIDLRQKLASISIEYLVNLSLNKFRTIDLRAFTNLQYLGRTVRARIQKISDFHYCKKIPTPILFIPDIQEYELCGVVGDVTTQDLVCNNAPTLICSYTNVGNCYLFVLGGINNSPVAQVSFKISTDKGRSFTYIPNLTTISAEYCTDSTFMIVAEVVYADGCASIDTAPKTVTPCPVVTYEGVCDFTTLTTDGVDNYFLLPKIICSDPLLDFTVLLVERCDWDGTQCTSQRFPVDLNGPRLPVTPGDMVKYFATVQHKNCDPVDLEWVCELPPNSPLPPDCSDIDLDFTCEDQGNGCFKFKWEGTIPLFLEVDYTVKYRCSTDGITYDYWKIWEGEDVCCQFVEAKLFVDFCNDECPRYCKTLSCEPSCTPFEAGAPSNLTVCNDGDL